MCHSKSAPKNTEAVQFSVPGETIDFCVIYGPTPKQILDRYTALVGRPANVPAWSYGLWLTTSFTTKYDEKTINSFIDGMAERDIPLSAFHYDCYWMREFHWTDFEWDKRFFGDIESTLKRLHEDKGLHICAWINPYIGQRGSMFKEGKDKGYLVKKANGEVWQTDFWQAGMGLVDFTNPEARDWFKGKVKALLHQGVDAIKTDFGERIPRDVVWHDGSPKLSMHNWYTQLYNQAVFEAIEETYGKGKACLFARSATVGGQRQPVHWGGDCESTFNGMAQTLRAGLSITSSGFGFWSHDIGGFEGAHPDPAVYKRWVAFGLLGSHSRMHGSTVYRVPWLFDEEDEKNGVVNAPGQTAVDVARTFTKLKLSLMPYLFQTGLQPHLNGLRSCAPCSWSFRMIRLVVRSTANTCSARTCWWLRCSPTPVMWSITCLLACGPTGSLVRRWLPGMVCGAMSGMASTPFRCGCARAACWLPSRGPRLRITNMARMRWSPCSSMAPMLPRPW